jgi:hypothetical protein
MKACMLSQSFGSHAKVEKGEKYFENQHSCC